MRSTSGMEDVINVGREECKRVTGRSEDGGVRDGNMRSEGRIARGDEVIGVRINLEGYQWGQSTRTLCNERTVSAQCREVGGEHPLLPMRPRLHPAR